MIVGAPKEIENNENRVSLTPAGVHTMASMRHRVLVEHLAGAGSGFSDEEYIKAGAEIESDHERLFTQSELIVKVKEPLPEEYDLLKCGQILFTYLHLASNYPLSNALLARWTTAIAYEAVKGRNGGLPLLSPMSEIAGHMATQIGSFYLLKFNNGQYILRGGVAGVPPGLVVIIGGGTVGLNAARMAAGLGALVVIIESSPDRMRYLDDQFAGRVITVRSNPYNIADWVRKADLLIGAVLIPGARAPMLVTKEMIRAMKPGSVVIDVAIDQGGSIETIDHVSTHSDPVYDRHGVLHDSVANMPGAAPRTSTFALTNATLDYLHLIANKGWRQAFLDEPGLASGVNMVDGILTCQGVSDAHGLPFTDIAICLRQPMQLQPSPA